MMKQETTKFIESMDGMMKETFEMLGVENITELSTEEFGMFKRMMSIYEQSKQFMMAQAVMMDNLDEKLNRLENKMDRLLAAK